MVSLSPIDDALAKKPPAVSSVVEVPPPVYNVAKNIQHDAYVQESTKLRDVEKVFFFAHVSSRNELIVFLVAEKMLYLKGSKCIHSTIQKLGRLHIDVISTDLEACKWQWT